MENTTARPLILFGSPHADGPTAALVQAFLEREKLSMEDCGWLSAYSLHPLPCVDCGWCKANPDCRLPDLKEFYAAFEETGLLILAAPVYNAGLPAPLKAMIDRTQVYFNARFHRQMRPPIARPKKAVLLFTAGSDKDFRSLLLEQLAPMFTVTNCKFQGAALLGNLDRHPLSPAHRAERLKQALADIPPLLDA